MKTVLEAVSDIRGGYPFRGSVPEVASGSAYAVQMKDVSPDGTVAWDTVVRTEVPSRRESHWLRAGDVLFVTRGARFFAVALGEVPVSAVCSPNFYLLRTRDTSGVLPEFLAWQINQHPAQRYLSKGAEGSNQQSIRRQVLAAMPFKVLTITQQQRAVELARLALRERTLHEALLQNREQQLRMIANRLLKID